MKIIKDTLEPIIETWDDPGDYPSGAGGGPLPSYKYIDGCEGELVIELAPAEILQMIDDQEGLDGCLDTSHRIRVKKWIVKKMEIVNGNLQVAFNVDECEGEVEEDDPREYERDEDC